MITEAILDTDDDSTLDDPLAPFLADGLITEVLRTEKSGKEGTVYCCRAGKTTGYALLAVKVYRPRSRRNFKNDSVYREGRVILNGHDRRAVKKKSAWGREFQFASWIGHEFATLSALHDLGADVPAPILQTSNAILMEYVGDEQRAAPLLCGVTLEPSQVRPTFERLMSNIEGMLSQNYVHGDLSAFNVLFWKGKATIIDFPQAIDPRQNTHAFDLLARDVDRICAHFARYGVQTDPSRIARHLWGRFLRAEL